MPEPLAPSNLKVPQAFPPALSQHQMQRKSKALLVVGGISRLFVVLKKQQQGDRAPHTRWVLWYMHMSVCSHLYPERLSLKHRRCVSGESHRAAPQIEQLHHLLQTMCCGLLPSATPRAAQLLCVDASYCSFADSLSGCSFAKVPGAVLLPHGMLRAASEDRHRVLHLIYSSVTVIVAKHFLQ